MSIGDLCLCKKGGCWTCPYLKAADKERKHFLKNWQQRQGHLFFQGQLSPRVMGKEGGEINFRLLLWLGRFRKSSQPGGRRKTLEQRGKWTGFPIAVCMGNGSLAPSPWKGGNGNITPQNMRIALAHWYPKEGKKKWSQKWWQMAIGLKFAHFSTFPMKIFFFEKRKIGKFKVLFIWESLVNPAPECGVPGKEGKRYEEHICMRGL